MSDDNPLPFRIKPSSPPPPQPSLQETVGAKNPPQPPAPVVRTAGRFRTPGALLSYVGLVAASRLAQDADCRSSPDGQFWWGVIEASWERASEVIWSAGGRPFAWQNGAWVPVLPGGEPTPGPTGPVPAEPPDWPESGLPQLLAGGPLAAGAPVTAESCAVLAPGALARWVIRRALAAGLTGTFVPVRAAPLHGAGAPGERVLIRLSSARTTVPTALAAALARLPGVAVTTPVGGPGGRVLVDVRCRSPLSGIDLDPMIPTNETWVLAAEDVGHFRLTADGPEVNLAGFLRTPAAPSAPLHLAPTRLPPSEVPVRLVRDPVRRTGTADAVLVDDAQLEWLRRFLPARPSGEIGFLLPGPGRHLLTGPAGLPDQVPFGVPLVRVGPGGLFTEAGCGFEPPLPAGARRAAFGVGEKRTVAVTRDGTFAFDPANLVPAWVLWLGPAPAVTDDLSAPARRALTGIAESIRQAEREREAAAKGREMRPPVPEDRGELLREAMRLELAGELVEAAGLLERAAEYLRAARLYERAAEGL